MSTAADERFMALAIALGARGLGRVWPNPAVGCVIVKDGRIAGRGWTQPGGRPHAETVALAQAGAAARGATAYVSLEPCAHHARTPPCAEALVAAGVARVVSALTDPDSRVAGRGHAVLRNAGIEVTEGVLRAEATRAQWGFLSRIVKGRPHLTLKLATTLDGRIATATGESRWITGPEARRQVHALRLSNDAVMVGAGTALADDPDLTVRDLGAGRQPVRIVIDSRLSLPPDSRLGRTAEQVPVWLCHGPGAPVEIRRAWQARGARLIEAPVDDSGRVEIAGALEHLGEIGLTRILCEGGAALAASLLRADCVDELQCYAAGKVLGGDGLAAVAAMGVTGLPQGPSRFALLDVRAVGGDTVSRWARRELV